MNKKLSIFLTIAALAGFSAQGITEMVVPSSEQSDLPKRSSKGSRRTVSHHGPFGLHSSAAAKRPTFADRSLSKTGNGVVSRKGAGNPLPVSSPGMN